MSVQIDMTNYEAFYLDFLEGNLSGEALEAFEAFLAEHPELAVDDSPLFTLEAQEETYDPIHKLALKKGIDLNDLNTETIEFFLIAREEGLLDTEQKAHLNHWLEANAHYRQDAELYALVQLEADESIVYANKKSLHKPQGGGRIIPMWWSAGVAVAAGVALIVTIGLNGPNTVKTDPINTAVNPVHVPTTDSGKNGSGNSNDQTSPVDDQANNKKDRNDSQASGKQKRANENPQPVRKQRPGAYQRNNILLHETVIASLEKRQATVPGADQQIAPIPFVVKQQDPVATEERSNEDMAWTPIDEMKNPIQPVTTVMSNTFNTQVDFRTAKANKRKGGGFFLKIGKWELSHTPGSQSASL